MITRYNYKWTKPKKVVSPIKFEYELVTQIVPVSFNEDKSVKEYTEKSFYKVKKTLWADFIKSFDLGSISEQVMNHILKGTPLVTAHTLPAGDYTPEALLKGAEIVREMRAKGITLDMVSEALSASSEASSSASESEANNG